MEFIQKNKNLVVGGLVILVLIVGYMMYDKKEISIPTETTEEKIATTTKGDVISNASGDYKIEQISFDEPAKKTAPKPIPNLDRPVTSPDSTPVSPEALTRATEEILKLQKMLKSDPTNLAAWIDLGMFQRMAGDLAGTVISWQYATKLSPNHFIAYANLGNLYAYALKDNTQAEYYYKKAISLAPNQAYLYIQLAEVYRDIIKDLGRARAIVNDGLSKVPNDPNLIYLRDSLR